MTVELQLIFVLIKFLNIRSKQHTEMLSKKKQPQTTRAINYNYKRTKQKNVLLDKPQRGSQADIKLVTATGFFVVAYKKR